MRRVSITAAAALAQKKDEELREKIRTKDGQPSINALATDSFVNFSQKMGMGADNALSTSSYGFNPISRNRNLLEWIHRGSWIGGVAVDLVADDMTRAGVEFLTELPPDATEQLERVATNLGTWNMINECIRWGRLYGGSICVALIDGQDFRQPLRLETVGPKQFKGLLTLDRWMVEPSLEDLVTEMGPHLGLPKYYRVQANAPALRGCAIHHSRVMIRHVGVELPYQQRLMENLWGLSVIERLYDRMVAFDSASMGAAQLVYKAYLRTLKVTGLREIVAQGGKALDGLVAYTEMMRRYQGNEGVTLLDAEDEFDVQQTSAISGIGDSLTQFGQQLSGALQIPLVRLFGQSPQGMNATGESDMRLYYDHIKQQQVKNMLVGVTNVYRLIAQSEGIRLPDTFSVDFRSLWELSDTDKANIASTVGTAVSSAVDSGLIGRQTGLKELRQSGRRTGVFTNITEQMIAAADDEVGPPPGMELALPGMEGLTNGNAPKIGQNGQVPGMAGVPRPRAAIQLPAPAGGKTGQQPPQAPTRRTITAPAKS